MTARGAPYVLSLLVAGLMTVQAVLGLVFPDTYRDVEWIRATWFGNDGVTLLVAVPLLLVALAAARHGSGRGTLLWLGLLGYAGYNYAFHLFGAALNAFFPIYAVLVVLTVAALVLALARLDVERLSPTATGRPVRTVAGYLVVVGVGLAGVWLTTWAGYAFAGIPTPVEPEAFKVVAALDLTVMCTALVVGGMLLWRRRPWGLVVATLASVQGTLYLLVLTVNSIVSVARGLAPAPGQLPLWGPLTLTTAAAATLLLAKTADGRREPRRVRGAAHAADAARIR
jgi:hypothetical protein